MTFAFRLRIDLPSPHVLIAAESEVPIGGVPFAPDLTVSAVGADSISNAARLAFRAGGFESEDDARKGAEALREALVIACAAHRVGLNLGKDRSTFNVSDGVRRSMEEAAEEATGVKTQILQDVHGIVVFEEIAQTAFLGGSATGVVGRQLGQFLETLIRNASSPRVLEPQLRLAFDLYNSAPFESTPRARFVSLITCMEVLAARDERPATSVAHIEQLIAFTQASDLSEQEIAAVTNGLQNLKIESIGAACRRLITPRASVDDVGLWQRAHGLRHRMLHAGVESAEVQEILPALEQLVARVLLSLADAA